MDCSAADVEEIKRIMMDIVCWTVAVVAQFVSTPAVQNDGSARVGSPWKLPTDLINLDMANKKSGK